MEQKKRDELETALIELEGTSPLLMHADNIDWADKMDTWRKDPENKALSKAGDDRTPPWRWIGALNYDDPKGGCITIPSEYLMACIMRGAARVSTGRGKSTFKSESQSGLLCRSFHFPLLVREKEVKMQAINKLLPLKKFSEHVDAVQDMGFSLFVKRARVGTSKHIRVRPRFDTWKMHAEIIITNEQITKQLLQTILDICGGYVGLGNWRPGCPTPGPFGMFKAKVS